jgi:NAD(P)-dependent dehydrogenase (short-subunit alcohol dehydrogenase family)
MSKVTLDLNHLFSLQGKVALVTGGSRGIGCMITQGLLQPGSKVYISARNEEACQQAATELSKYGQCYSVPSRCSKPTKSQFIMPVFVGSRASVKYPR